MTGSRGIRLSGLLLVAATAWYLPWLLGHVNERALWLAIPFVGAHALLLTGLGLSLVNNWTRSAPPDLRTPRGSEPDVGVIITSAGEDPRYVDRTARSVLDQDWPHERLHLLLSDDARDPAIEAVARRLAAEHPRAHIGYHVPPERGSAERRGDAKAGNLNSALDRMLAAVPGLGLLETRDADDEVGDREFLSRCAALLLDDPRLAYVQTVKEAVTSEGDPFDNLQPQFFRGAMHGRHAANAVFPCGSGLLWRVEALEDIGGFPSWNLVEDLQSGVEALRRGWRSAYLPIVGAVGQHAPEDLANLYKQRGTWALDTVRLLVWGDRSGLGLRQRLQFAEVGMFYLQSASTVVFVLAPVLGFVAQVYPLETDLASYVAHFWPFAAALELFLAVLSRPNSYESLWRARTLWIGLAPVYLRATVLAVLGGPNRKPVYTVTRKSHEHVVYWRAVAPQALLLLVLAGGLLYGAATTPLLTRFDVGSAYWSVLYLLLLGSFVRLSWFGVRPVAPAWAARLRARLPLVAGGAAALAACALGAAVVATGACGGSGCRAVAGPDQTVFALAAVGVASALVASRRPVATGRALSARLNLTSALAFTAGLVVLAVGV